MTLKSTSRFLVVGSGWLGNTLASSMRRLGCSVIIVGLRNATSVFDENQPAFIKNSWDHNCIICGGPARVTQSLNHDLVYEANYNLVKEFLNVAVELKAFKRIYVFGSAIEVIPSSFFSSVSAYREAKVALKALIASGIPATKYLSLPNIVGEGMPLNGLLAEELNSVIAHRQDGRGAVVLDNWDAERDYLNSRMLASSLLHDSEFDDLFFSTDSCSAGFVMQLESAIVQILEQKGIKLSVVRGGMVKNGFARIPHLEKNSRLSRYIKNSKLPLWESVSVGHAVT